MNLLLEPKEFRLLEGMRLNPRKGFTGRIRGERLTRKKGTSIEFADYREYSEGDDLRHLDWNVLARLDSTVMRTYQDEEDLAVHLLLDVSASMGFGEPSKADVARRLALAMGYVALSGGDTLYPRFLNARNVRAIPMRGRSAYARAVAWSDSPPERPEGFASGLRAFLSARVRTGLVIIVSDALDPDAPSLIRALGGRGHEVQLLQILSPIELDPDLEGDLRLVDAEGGPAVEITANGSVLREYRSRLAAHNDAIADAILRVGGRYRQITTEWDVARVAQHVWKREGWVR
jgi:uncharacterized protein (DUF58 family)